LALTRSGRRLLARAAAAAAESEQRSLVPLAVEERQRLKDALRVLLEQDHG
jgi:DNA-binding MarR family transcriptional regulator